MWRRTVAFCAGVKNWMERQAIEVVLAVGVDDRPQARWVQRTVVGMYVAFFGGLAVWLFV